MVRLRSYGLITCLALTAALGGCAGPSVETPLMPEASRSLPQDPEAQAQTMVGMADRAMAAGDPETAARLYGQATGLAGDNVPVLLRLGETYLASRRWSDAAEIYRRVLVRHPTDGKAQRGYARAMLALDQPAAAAAHLEQVVQAAPDDIRALNALGVAYDMLGRHDEAQGTYEKGLALAPADPSLSNNLGLSLALAGYFVDAVATLEPLANGVGSSPRARQNLALAYGLEGNTLAAERIGLLDLDASSVQSNQTYFMALRGMGDSGAAAAALVADPSVQPRVQPDIEIVRTWPERPVARSSESASLPASVDGGPGAPTPLASGAAPAGHGADRDLPTTPAAVALDASGMTSGLAPIGSWLVDLGSYDSQPAAVAAWRELRKAHPDLLGGMTRLAGSGSGPQSLLAGPIVSEAEADRLCRDLDNRGSDCAKLKI